MSRSFTGLKVGIGLVSMIGAVQATSIALSPISTYSANTTWQDIKGTSYAFADANGNNQIDVGETVTFTVDMHKNTWGRHSFDALKIWIDGTPIAPPSTTLDVQQFQWNFSTGASRGNGAYDYLAWAGGDKFFSFDYTFTTAGIFDLTASVMCSADLSGLNGSGSFDAPNAADWAAWTENIHGPGGSKVYQGETERYQLRVYEAVPEPGTLALFGLSLMGMAGVSYFRRKKAV